MPLGLDFAIGLGSTDQARAAQITGLDELGVPVAGEPALYRRAIANLQGRILATRVENALRTCLGLPELID